MTSAGRTQTGFPVFQQSPRKLLAIIVFLLCLIPIALNILGIDFSSNPRALSADDFINGKVNTDALFYAVAGAMHHALLEWSAVSIAILATLASFIHYSVRRDVTVPIIGMALLSAGLVDAFHTLAATRIIQASAPNTDFIPFTWAISRIFNACIMIIGAIISLWIIQSSFYLKETRQQIVAFVTCSFLFLGLSYLVVHLAATSTSLPQTMYPDAMVARPFDVLPLALFLVGGTLFWVWYKKDHTAIKWALILSIIPETFTQLHMAFGSTALFDNHFNIAHGLKNLAYGSIFLGILIDLIFIPAKKVEYSEVAIPANAKHKSLTPGKAKRPLGIQIPLAAFVLSLIVATTVGSVFYFEGKNISLKNEQTNLENEAHRLEPIIAAVYERSYSDISFLSRTPPIQGIINSLQNNDKSNLSLWEQRLEKIFFEMLNANNSYKQIRYIGLSEQGKDIISVKHLPNGIFNIPKSRFQTNAQRDFFQNTVIKNIGEIYFSKIEVVDNNREIRQQSQSILKASIPIYSNTSGQLFGMVVIDIIFSNLLETLKLYSPEDLSLHLANEDGEYILHQDDERGINSHIEENMISNFPQLKKIITEERVDTRILTQSSSETDDIQGYYAKISLNHIGNPRPLHLLITFKNNNYLNAINSLRDRSLLLALSLALVVLAISVIASRRLIQPLTTMTDSVKNYERTGNLGLLPLNSKDEIGVLARSFNNLLHSKQMREEELSNTRKYVDGITDSVPVLLSYVDKNQRYKFVNKNYETWFDVDSNKIIGLTVEELLGDRAYQRFAPYIDRALTGETISFDSEIPYMKGSRHVHATYTPDINSNNQVLGFFVSIEDITNIKDAEIKLRELSWRMEFALNAPGIGVWDFNLKTKELIWDKRMYQIFGVDPKEHPDTYKLWKSRIHSDDLPFISDTINQSSVSGEDFNLEFRVIWPDDQIRYISAHAKVMSDYQGEHIRIVGTNHDITEQKKLQTEREEALQEAQDSAKLKSEFLASMSHEIRTPMNGVLGMLGLLLRSDLNIKQQHYATLARSSADSLLILINDILDFSKIEAGKLDLEILDFDLRHQLGEFSEAMALKAQEKGLEIILDVSQVNYSMVRGDPGRIRQILTNLVSNAIKFTDQGEIVISIKIEPRGNNDLILYGSVSDTGIGIAANKQDDLFGAFTQVDASTTRKFGGTGLGLAIVKQLCSLMQGGIGVQSSVGQGSQFNFNILLQKSKRSTAVLPKVQIKGKHILIVDDNETNREVLRGQLELWGAMVTEAEDGDKALELLQQHEDKPFSVAFLDMQMPNMSGATLGEKIRQQTAFDQMPMIMMTSIGERGDAQYFADLGFSAYFPKPTTTSDLFKALTVVIDGGEALTTASPLVTQYNIHSLEDEPSHIGQFGEAHILLVEDNPINKEVTLGMLEDMHIFADAAANGLEALAALTSSPDSAPYNLILMDCQMPEMDGYEATAKIREGTSGHRYKTIPIVALTANAMKGDKDRCLEAGMNDYLSKPLSLELLEEKLIQWLPRNNNDNSVSSDNILKPDTEVTLGANDIINEEADIDKEVANEKSHHSDSQAESAPLIWDTAAALKRVGGRPDRVKTLINMFLSDMPTRMEELENSIDNNIENVMTLAHTIKGVAGNLSGLQLFEQAGNLDQAAKNNNQQEVDKYWPLLEAEYNNLCIVFKKYLEEEE